MVDCKDCKYFSSFGTDWTGSLGVGACSIILPPWLKVEDDSKRVYPHDCCDLGVLKKE